MLKSIRYSSEDFVIIITRDSEKNLTIRVEGLHSLDLINRALKEAEYTFSTFDILLKSEEGVEKSG